MAQQRAVWARCGEPLAAGAEHCPTCRGAVPRSALPNEDGVGVHRGRAGTSAFGREGGGMQLLVKNNVGEVMRMADLKEFRVIQ